MESMEVELEELDRFIDMKENSVLEYQQDNNNEKTLSNLKSYFQIKKEESQETEGNLEDLHHSIDIKDETSMDESQVDQDCDIPSPIHTAMETNDILDFLLKNNFNALSYEEKCKLKTNRPTPSLSLEYKEGKFKRKFQRRWYTKFLWLTGCDKRNKMFCFTCVIFGGEKEWSVHGLSTIKNFIRKAENHSISKNHLKNQEKFHVLGQVRIEHESQRLAALNHNEKVGINRRVLARLIHVVCFLGKQELPFRGKRENSESLNKGNYLELLELLAQEDLLLKEHCLSSLIFKETSNTIQNDLIECVTSVLNLRIFKEMQTANYISIQADETTDVSCRSQISIILRYVIEHTIVERFIGFFDVSKNKTASVLADVLLSEINKWEIGNKIVCQTYDGASVVAGEEGGVQCIIKKSYTNALFIYSYAHELNLVLLHGAKTIKAVKLFICNLTMFHTFFSRSTKRSKLLREQGFKLPRQSNPRWNYHSRAASTIKIHFLELKNAMIHVTEEPNWDPISICTASGLLDKLNNPEFVFLLVLFSKIFVYTDNVFNFLQLNSLSNIKSCIQEIQNLKQNLTDLRKDVIVNNCCDEAITLNNNLEYLSSQRINLRKTTYEILDSLIVQIDARFEDFAKLEFVELTNEKMFSRYHKTFPESKFVKLLEQYPNIFDQTRLRNELSVIYSDVGKHLPPHELLEFLIKNDLQDIYPQFTKLYQLVLTIPATTASSERSTMSTLKRTKTFLRNTMTNERLSKLSFMAIEKTLLGTMVKDPTFVENVIDEFAKKKDRRIELVYKKI